VRGAGKREGRNEMQELDGWGQQALLAWVAFPAPAGSGCCKHTQGWAGCVGGGLKTGMKRIFANHWVVAAGEGAQCT
jgi:hypothetical protein